MNILLDTKLLIQVIAGSSDFPEDIRKEYIEDPANEIYYSTVSLTEIQMAHEEDPNSVSFDARAVQVFCQRSGFKCINLEEKHVMYFSDLLDKKFTFETDLFTRLLLAQTMCDGLTFFTHHKKYRDAHPQIFVC